MNKGVILTIEDGVARIDINNPPLNILDLWVRQELMRCFEILKDSDQARILVLRGTGGRAFSVGSNVREFPFDRGRAGGRDKVVFEQRLHDLLEGLPQVTIAVLDGYVLGGGCELMMPCDLRIASDRTVLGFPEVKIGGFPCSGGTQRLLRLVGPTAAKELLLFGEQITAQRAEQLGLVTRVVPVEQLDQTVEEMVQKLVQLPWQSLIACKSCVNAGMLSPQEGARAEVEFFTAIFPTHDMREGIRAFLEKRPPVFDHSRAPLQREV